MPTLLHIDASLTAAETSVTRQLTATFREEWLNQHPGGTVVYRDLTAEPIPHLLAVDHAAGDGAPLREVLASELEHADLILIGTPMHNFTIPSVLKAWIDQACVMGRTGGAQGTAAGTPTVVITSRGGGYGPETPNHDKEFVTTYLDAVLRNLFGLQPEFIVSELTLSATVPQMAHLRGLAEVSRAKAQQDVVARARALTDVPA